MDNFAVLTFLFWPAVVLLCAGINMLVTWTFSWSELVFDYFICVALGACFYAGNRPDAGPLASFFMVFSHGFLGLLYVASDGFKNAFTDVATLCWMLAGIRVGCMLG